MAHLALKKPLAFRRGQPHPLWIGRYDDARRVGWWWHIKGQLLMRIVYRDIYTDELPIVVNTAAGVAPRNPRRVEDHKVHMIIGTCYQVIGINDSRAHSFNTPITTLSRNYIIPYTALVSR